MSGAVLHSIDELGLGEIAALLDAAREFERSGRAGLAAPFSVGLLFLEPSLRTRVGFAEAAIRLGGTPIEVPRARSAPGMSSAESFHDTLRVLSGMVDVVVARVPFHADRASIEAAAVSPYVNGGDGAGNHPTQTLVDLYAIERARGPLADLRIGICGDLASRSSRSLIGLLNRVPPAALTLIAPRGRDDPGVRIGDELESRISRRDRADFSGIDVLYMAGLPEGGGAERLGAASRAAFALSAERLGELPGEALVLAPMPIIDEIPNDVRGDPRIGVYAQSDCGVYVRMAVLDAFRGR